MHLRPLTLIGIVVSMVSGIGLGIAGYHAWQDQRRDSLEAQDFDEVLSQVQESYVDELDRTELVDNALRGMLDRLDDHSDFLDSTEYGSLQDETRGHFGGVGIELGLVDGYFTVITPLDDTPADRAGLESGDRILELDGESLKGRKLVEVVNELRGVPGSRVQLTLARPTSTDTFAVSLVRADITVASVRQRLLEPGYGYVRISQFQANTGEEFTKALKRLRRENDGELDGLVLDLRNNPGGVLQASVDVADAFLEDGLIVYTAGRLPSSHLKYRASGADLLEGKPIVVLINQGSASASEIVAGALQDHHRARLLGTKSYGKGSVQSVMPLSGDRAIKLTTAYYYTPSGRSIHHTGIEPDVAFDFGARPDDESLFAEALALLKTPAVPEEAVPEKGLHARL
jgi:carboxyl-terminal processing protease